MIRSCIITMSLSWLLAGCGPSGTVWEQHSSECYQEAPELEEKHGRMALLLTSFETFDEFKSVVEIQYLPDSKGVTLTHKSSGYEVISELRPGLSEGDLKGAVEGALGDKLSVAARSPYAVIAREELQGVEWLARHRPGIFGQDDVAFYDIAERMVRNLSIRSKQGMTDRDLDEKGYLNTFNHVIAQAFMTSLYSEKLADFVADLHERENMPQLISGDFTEEQIIDLEFGALDNYLDMVNNEWGQEIGKYLSKELGIVKGQCWDYDLVSDYINGIQGFMSRSFGVSFTPLSAQDAMVVKWAGKLNMATGNCQLGVDKLFAAGCITCPGQSATRRSR